MPKRLPMAVALELAMTGDPIDAARAFDARPRQQGGARPTRCWPRPLALAERIAANAPLAVRYSKSVMKQAAEVSEAEGWKINGEAVGRRLLLGRRHGGPRRLRREAPAQLAGQVGGTAVLAPALDTIRLTLHVLAATVWVGGQIVMAGLVGPGPWAGARRPQDPGPGLRPVGLARLRGPAGHGRLERDGRPLRGPGLGLEDGPVAKIAVVVLAGAGRPAAPAGHVPGASWPSGGRSGAWPAWPRW